MKKLLLVLVMLLVLAGCGSSNNSSSDKVKVGVLQLVTHDALDKAYKGFKDALKEAGYEEGKNLVIDYQNPEADQSNLKTMADALTNGKNAVILAIATTPAQVLLNASNGTPIIGTAITDFVESGLANSNDNPGKGVAGVSDGTPAQGQLDLLLEFNPNIKKIGIIYTSSEPNSKIQSDAMEKECKDRGIDVVIKTVSDKNDIEITTRALVKEKIEALYIPTDNNIASAMSSIDIVTIENKIPTLVADSGMCINGGLLSIGVDYYRLGKQAGEMAVSIIKGEKTINDLKIEHQEELDVYYSSKTASKMGVTIPDSILERGVDVDK